MLFITIGFLLAHIALVAGALFLRDGEHLWVLGLMFGWYCFAMLAFIAAIWVHYIKTTRSMGSSRQIPGQSVRRPCPLKRNISKPIPPVLVRLSVLKNLSVTGS
ncbi:hypothetical protein E0J16_25000 [Rhizobium pisi]|nr:hypothetical protein E0J16_25000 [Rhizobium pisi]